MTPIFPRDALRTLIGYWNATGNYLAGAKVHLFTNQISISPTTPLTALTEATFDGYSAASITTWLTPYSDVLGNAILEAQIEQFLCTGSTVSETIYGAYLTNTLGTALLMAINFATPVHITQAGDAVIFSPQVSLGQPPV
jgi:hypothetical protein